MNIFKKGQVSVITAIIGSVGIIGASGITAWATANAKVQVVEEREGNHYKELSDDLERIEGKLDRVIEQK